MGTPIFNLRAVMGHPFLVYALSIIKINEIFSMIVFLL